LGKGSTFYFSARFQVHVAPLTAVAAPLPSLQGLRILVVDDNDTNRLILREMLARWGGRVTEAADGPAALARMNEMQACGVPYQLVLLDSRMPGMDGFQVAQVARNTLDLARVSIIMLTSDMRVADMARVRELGLAAYLIKPIGRAKLLDAIAATLHHTPSAAPTPLREVSPAGAEDRQALRILLVDDSADNRMLIHAYLKQMPYRLDCVENGALAVEKVQAGAYDLVLMDMQMPVMDGYEATKRIRALEGEQGLSSEDDHTHHSQLKIQRSKSVPIIALTANALKEEMQRSLDAGCTGHLAKPIKKATLLAAIADYAALETPS
jgi:CheY-like chemotaxis protein